VPGARLVVPSPVEADASHGFDTDKIRTVGENATTLTFDRHGFEES